MYRKLINLTHWLELENKSIEQLKQHLKDIDHAKMKLDNEAEYVERVLEYKERKAQEALRLSEDLDQKAKEAEAEYRKYQFGKEEE